MGNKQSTSSIVDVKVLNETVTDFLQKNSNQVQNITDVNQKNYIKNSIWMGCTPNFTNESITEVKVVQEFTAASTADLVSNLTNKLETQAETEGTQEQQFMSTMIASENKSKSEIKQDIKNKITNKITQESLNQVINKVKQTQNNMVEGTTIDVCGYSLFEPALNNPEVIADPVLYGTVSNAYQRVQTSCKNEDGTWPDCGSANEMEIYMVTTQISDMVLDALVDNTISTDSKADAKAKSDQKGTGFFEGLGSMFASMWVIWIAMAIVFMVGLYFFFKPKKAGNGPSAANAAFNLAAKK